VTGKLRKRRLREQLNAVYEYVDTLYAPIREGNRSAPTIVLDCFDGLLGTLDEFDRQLAKLSGNAGAVGGEMVLREDWNKQKEPFE
jgi:hypothetical protein